MRQISVNEITLKAFESALKSHFQVRLDVGQSLNMELVEVISGPAHNQFEIFSLIFRGPAESRLQQQTFSFSHPQFGAFELFIAPIRQESDGLYYEAAFNRDKKA